MDKFLITPRAYNKKLGPIMVTTSARSSCPDACPLSRNATGPLKGTCYAEQGFIGAYMWANLDRVPLGGTFKRGQIKVHSFEELLAAVRDLPDGAMWRHNQAGDLASDDGITINREKLRRITEANKGRRGFTFTHYPVLDNRENQDAIHEANKQGFTVNLSANSPSEADRLAALDIGPVATLLPDDVTDNTQTPEGRTIAICPAVKYDAITCATCGICTKQHKAVVGFPAIGRCKENVADAEKEDAREEVYQLNNHEGDCGMNDTLTIADYEDGAITRAPFSEVVMPEQNFQQFIAKERAKLTKAREEELAKRAEIDARIEEIDTEFAAIDAYEATKLRKNKARGGTGTRRNGRRQEVLAVIKKHPQGIKPADIKADLGAHDKSAQQSVSNALSALKKTNLVTASGGVYKAV